MANDVAKACDRNGLTFFSGVLHDATVDLGAARFDRDREQLRLDIWRECRELGPHRRWRLLLIEVVWWPRQQCELVINNCTRWWRSGDTSLREAVVESLEAVGAGAERIEIRCAGSAVWAEVRKLNVDLVRAGELTRGFVPLLGTIRCAASRA